MNDQHSLISRQFFRCATDKPFVRHDFRIWESRAGREPRLKDGDGRVLFGDALLADWRARAKRGAARVRMYYDVHPVARQHADARPGGEEPLRRSAADDRAPTRRGDRSAAAADETAHRRPLRAARAQPQRQGPVDERRRLSRSSGRRLPDGHRSGDQRVRQLRPDARSRNLFVVGSPTLPTGGCTNGTLTFAALTLRSATKSQRR